MSLRGAYNKINDSQREILVRYFNNGMTSKTAAYKQQIEAAAKESNLSEEQVCIDRKNHCDI